ncbi:ARM repeat-containing protein [Atractiella rhizophila]|nr:ARM repeat-containing protein [Atractiella rhizophila]
MVSKSHRRLDLRKANLAAVQDVPSTPPLGSSKLDSSLKRHTALIKKLKTSLHSAPSAEFIKEIKGLTIMKYMEEVVSAVVEGTGKCRKEGEVQGAVEVMSAMHQRFPTLFTPPLTANFLSLLAPSKASASAAPEQREKEDTARVSRQRVLLRIFAELELVGLVMTPTGPTKNEGENTFQIIKELLTADKEALLLSIPVATAFAKQLGNLFLPSSADNPPLVDDADNSLGDEDIIPVPMKEKFKKLFTQYYDALSRRAVKENLFMKETDRRNHEAYIRSGQIFEDRAQNYETLAKSFEKLWAGVTSLSEVLGTSVPELPSLPSTTITSTISFGGSTGGPTEGEGVGSIWADEEERKFYEDIVDLKGEVPGSVLVSTQQPQTSNAPAKLTSVPEPIKAEEAEDDDDAPPTLKEDPEEALPPAPAAQLQAILARLPECTSRATIDKAAVDFAFLNSKPARKRLTRFLASVSRNRTDLLPYYARLTATLSKYMPDIGSGLIAALEDEFRYLQRKKSVNLAETRAKNTRYLAELTKFKITPNHLILFCIKSCVDDLTGPNVDNLCNLLEGSGRFLLKSEATGEKTASLLEVMKRKKAAQNFTHQQITMLENAYYQCDPPDRVVIPPKERTPMELFLRHLFFNVLTKKTIDSVIKTLRKMHWEDPKIFQLLVSHFTKVWKAKFSNIHLFAILLHDLSKFHPDFHVVVVDQVLENLKIGMEVNNFKYNQQRIATIKYIGEMYNYRVIDSKVVLDVLWTLTMFGHPGNRPSPEDPSLRDAADDFFRVRLTCTLLDTCGSCFDRGQLRKKLDHFLIFFQMYILAKQTPPMDVGFMINDTFDSLRPKMTMMKTYEEASNAVDNMVAANQAAVESHEPAEEELDDDASDGEVDIASDPMELASDSESSDEAEEDPDAHEAERDESEDEDEMEIGRNTSYGPTVEDEEEFERELAKMMIDTSDSRKAANEKRTALADVALPVWKKKEKIRDEELDDEEDGLQHMKFTVLTKKGNKNQTRTLQVPVDSAIAVHTRSKQEQVRAEQQQLKKLVLEFEEREEAQEKKSLQESMAKRGIRIKYGEPA